MTSAHLTAGLSVQDTRTPESSAAAAWLTAGLAASELAHSGYELCAGRTMESIDYDAPVALTAPGVSSTAIALTDGTWWLACRSVSAAGVESDPSKVLRVEIENGALLDPRPNPIAPGSVVALPGPGGKVHLEFAYHAQNAPAAATRVAVVRRAADGALDWSSPIQTIPISGDTHWSGDLDGVYADRELVKLAIRAETAAGRGGRETVCLPVVADAAAPPAASTLTATQETDPS